MFMKTDNMFEMSPRGSFAQYNANNSWNFNGNNRVLNNNNRYNSNFRPRPAVDSYNISYQRYPLISFSSPEEPLTEYVGLDELIDVYIRCRNTKYTCIEFDTNLIKGLIMVYTNINNKSITIDEVRAFIIRVPKLREIIFCPYKDKLIQSFYVLSINNYLEDEWFIDDSFSCRQNKGVIAAINKFQQYIHDESLNYTLDNIWVAGFDIYHFFIRIDCKLAAEKMMIFIREHLSDNPRKDLLIYLTRLLYLTDYSSHIITDKYYQVHEKFISIDKSLIHNPPFIGVPIGNWPSQIIGNFLTTFVLLFIKSLGYKFIHYTDDTAVIIRDKDVFLNDIKKIRQFYIEDLHLLLHPDKFYLQPYQHGIEILGRKCRYNRVLPSDRTYHTINCLVNDAVFLADYYPWIIYDYCEDFMNTLNSYLGLLRSMNTFNFRQYIIYKLMRSRWNEVFYFEGHYNQVWMKNKYTRRNKYRLWAKQSKIQLWNKVIVDN